MKSNIYFVLLKMYKGIKLNKEQVSRKVTKFYAIP